jgi:FkbM family methyltransferase
VTQSRIPWDSPSRYGRAGLLARRALRRVLRPVTVRAEAEQARLGDELSQLRSRQADLGAEASEIRAELAQSRISGERLTHTLGELRDRLGRVTAYSAAVDNIVESVLVRELSPGVRRRTSSAGECSRVICSLATGDYRSLLSRSALSFERYAERWGWDLVLSTEHLADGRPAPWAKVPLLRSLLDEYDWVLWLDADVVIVDLDADISAEIQDDKDLYLVEHPWLEQYTANSGVVLLRSCAWSRDFLDQVWALDRYAEHPWWENAAVLHLLGYGLEPARLVEPTPWLRGTKFIDRRWNSIELDRSEHPAFVHRGFYDLRTRIRQVTGDLACALGSADPLTAGWDRPARRIATVADVSRRDEIPLLLNSLGLIGAGVEVGVRKGHFSEHILEHWRGEKLISIDPWRAEPRDEYIDISNVTQDEHDGNYSETCQRLARFGQRSELWRGTGAEAIPAFPAECLDFVYLDARHDAQSVSDDLESWWPLVRPRGLIAGHDYLDGALPEGVFGVRSAVDAFFGKLGFQVHVTTDDAPWPSWLAIKPEHPGQAPDLTQVWAASDPDPAAVHVPPTPTTAEPTPRLVAEPTAAGDANPIGGVLASLARRESFTIVQVGAYIGDTVNDPLYPFLCEQLHEHPQAVVVLVEPVASYFEQLRATYAGLTTVRLENVAIAESDGDRDLFRLGVSPTDHGQPEWLAQLGSLRQDRMTELWNRYEQALFDREGRTDDLRGFWHAHRTVERVRCMTIHQLLERHGISQLDLLQIDAEGYDYSILKTIDFGRIRPRFVNYERVLLHDDEPACRAMMTAAGYALFDWGQDTLCVAVD